MGDGSIYWYRQSMSAAEIGEQLDRFSELGLVLENGHSGRITMLNQVGEQVPTTREGLIAELTGSLDVSFQLWFQGTSVDVYCRFRRLSESTTAQTYGLDGQTEEERLQVRAILWDAFGRNLAASEALVVDIFDRTDELVDWDAAATHREIPTTAVPDLVVMRVPGPPQRTPRSVLYEFRMVSRRDPD
jgi:hypothetical protein